MALEPAEAGEQMRLLQDEHETRLRQAMSAVDALRDRYGDSAVSLASGMSARFRERTHENPAERAGNTAPSKRGNSDQR